VNGNEVGWLTFRTIGILAAAGLLLLAFLVAELRVRHPLVPLGLFRHRTLSTANGVAVLLAGAMFAWFFLSALYLQLVLGYSPLEVGLAFLPATIIMGSFSLGLSAKLVMKFGLKPPLFVGMLFMAAGLLLFTFLPVDGNYLVDVVPGMILLGIGAGMGFNPLLLAAMGDVEPTQAGLASGLVNTAFMMGGALGLAILASVSASRSDSLLASGDSRLEALTGGYHTAFLIGSLFAIAGAVLGGLLIKAEQPQEMHAQPEPMQP
jgi:predicted MFS family arabinose efflux permease